MKIAKQFALCMAVLLTGISAKAQEQKPVSMKLQNIEGWTVKVDPVLLNEQKKAGEIALKALANHLQRIAYIVPRQKLKELRRLPIWLEFKNRKLTNMQYHPSKGWLASNGHDIRLEKHVHIPVAAALTDRKMWAKHPYVVLHELAHAYHDQVLGFRHAGIVKAYDNAVRSRTYEKTLDHRGKNVKHYGLNNPKEFFAEATEAYFGVNDFYPFVRAELKKHDPKTHSLMESIWGKIK